MKLLIISDTHSPSRNEIDFYDFLKDKEFDYLLHLGDFDSFDTYNEIVSIIGREKLLAVAGNCDSIWNRGEIGEYLEITLKDKKIGLVHSHQLYADRTDMNARYQFMKNKGVDILFFGHTHVPTFFEINNDKLIEISKPKKIDKNKKYLINPGSLIDKNYILIEL